LCLTPSAFAFKLTPVTPANGHVVTVRSSAKEVYVHLVISVDLSGCFINPQVQPYHVELFEMRFASLNGRGKGWLSGYRGLLKPDHRHLVEDFNSGSPTITLAGDASIIARNVVNGELLRWTLPAQCADAGDPNVTDKTVATGTVRIAKKGSSTTSTPTRKRRPTHRRATPAPFRITRIDSPQSVQQNGPRGIATIHWSGGATFPVRMHDAPASCPPGLSCYAETKVVSKRANPLTWSAWWCSGDLTSSWTLDFWFWLTDAKGRHTQKVRKQVTCDVG
jgi:hypothetical protein